MGCSRGFYSLAARNEAIRPDVFDQVDKKTNVPHNAAALSLFFCGLWFMYFLGGQFFGWFGEYAFDSSELPIVTIYPLYIPILILFMKKGKGFTPFQRFVLPSLGILSCLLMVVASIFRHKISNLYYLVVFALFMLVGALFDRKDGHTFAEILYCKITKKPLSAPVTQTASEEE
jgi:APA family basic amino acid/polyamine antiporter